MREGASTNQAVGIQDVRPISNHRIMTKKQCENAVKALQEQGFEASYVQGAPDDHGVWLDGVWNSDLEDTHSFRIHDEEVEWWGVTNSLKT
jgi:hypothetical protein